MEITINTDQKTIKLKGQFTLKEINKELKKLVSKDIIDEYDIMTDIEYIYPSYPIIYTDCVSPFGTIVESSCDLMVN